MERRVIELTQQVEHTKARNTGLEKRVAELVQQVEHTKTHNTRLEQRIDGLEAQVNDLRTCLSELFSTAARSIRGDTPRAVEKPVNVMPARQRARAESPELGFAQLQNEEDGELVDVVKVGEEEHDEPMSGRTLQNEDRGDRRHGRNDEHGPVGNMVQNERPWLNKNREDRYGQGQYGDTPRNNRNGWEDYGARQANGSRSPSYDRRRRGRGGFSHSRERRGHDWGRDTKRRREVSPRPDSAPASRSFNSGNRGNGRSQFNSRHESPSNYGNNRSLTRHNSPNNRRQNKSPTRSVDRAQSQHDYGSGSFKQAWIEPVTNDPTGWDLIPEKNGPQWDALDKTASVDEWPVVVPATDAEDPMMPASVNQMTGKPLPSAKERVREWQRTSVQESDIRPTESPPSEKLEAGGSPNPMLDESPARPLMESDSDSDDPLSTLQSRNMRIELTMSQLHDSAGTALTLDRLAPVWGVCGWVTEDNVPYLYAKTYGVPLWDAQTPRQTRTSLRIMEGISEWQQSSASPLLFRRGGHLKNARNWQRLFVQPATDAQLFFYLVTTVRQPLTAALGVVVERLWDTTFLQSPLKLRTVREPNQRAEVRWHSMAELWAAAVEWLQAVVRSSIEYGRKYMVDKISGWGGGADANAGLVFGLARDELLGLLAVAPVLLRGILTADMLLELEDELAQPI
ncbi:hypothetical protein IWW43_004394 [Coemansia sp. RSA 1935]|nr:hypothetical protein GGF47_000324 [Coemansia sp. RSA 2524]KAJ2530312.1 hypothetical protein IWW43_004394 [Coemansia sp. RSA 1935]